MKRYLIKLFIGAVCGFFLGVLCWAGCEHLKIPTIVGCPLSALLLAVLVINSIKIGQGEDPWKSTKKKKSSDQSQ